MTARRACPFFRFVICAPGETVSTGLDVSAIVLSFSGGDNLLDQSGIVSFTGELVLQGYPILQPDAPLIDTNPRRDRIRWARGNRVIVWLDVSESGDGTLTRYRTLHILKNPLPPSPGTNPELTLQLGDKLSLLSFRQPPGDKSGAAATGTSRAAIISNLITAAGAGTVLGALPNAAEDSIARAQAQKTDEGSYIQQAGQMAFAASSYLWCDALGNVRIGPIDLDAAPALTLEIGRDEIAYTPIEGSETPAEIVRCTGTDTTIKRTPNSDQSQSTAWGLAAMVSPGGVGKTIVLEETVTDTWTGNIRTVSTVRREPRGLVFPEVEGQRALLIKSTEQIERWIYETGSEGKLLRQERSVWRPFGAALREYMATLDEANQNANRSTPIEAEDTKIDYTYTGTDVIARIESTTREPVGAILPNEDHAGGASVGVPAKAEIQTWTKLYKDAYRYEKSEYDAIARAFPEVVDAMPEGTPISNKTGTLLIRKTVESSNSGQTTPPAAERRKPEVEIEDRPIEGVAEFEPYAGSSYQERERVYDVPYANQQQLNAIAKLLGRVLIGRSMGQEIVFGRPTIGWVNVPPIRVIDVIEPDLEADGGGRTRQAYLVNGLAIAMDARTCELSVDGVWLGRAKITTPTTIEPGTGTETRTVMPPMVSRFTVSIGGGANGTLIVLPFNPIVPMNIAIGAGAQVRATSGASPAPWDISIGGGANVIGAVVIVPPIQFAVGSGGNATAIVVIVPPMEFALGGGANARAAIPAVEALTALIGGGANAKVSITAQNPLVTRIGGGANIKLT